MFNAYLISTLKFQFEKNDEFNYYYLLHFKLISSLHTLLFSKFT